MIRTIVTPGRLIARFAAEHPTKTALVFVPSHGSERVIPWSELDEAPNRIARLLAERGVREGDMVINALPNCPENLFVTFAIWRLGACVLPFRAVIPLPEQERIVEAAKPAMVVGDWQTTGSPVVRRDELATAAGFSAEPLPDKIARPSKAMASGGSTGRPKIIVDPNPWIPEEFISSVGAAVGIRSNMVQLTAGALYHNSPFCVTTWGLFRDHTIILMDKFDAARAADLIERYQVNFAYLAPIMMQRIARLPDVWQRDLTSIEAIYHTAAPCPAWLKRDWMDLIGPTHLYELYGSAEGAGHTTIRGDEWLEHPGSVGRPRDCDLRIIGEDGQTLGPGQVGEIFMRPTSGEPTFYYLGAPPAKSTADGYISIGDMGQVNEAGYLYLADRRVDMVVSGGANVYPAEVEAVLSEHPDVADVVIVGVPDEEWGKRVHAIIQPRDVSAPPAAAALHAYCRDRLISYKVPKSYEFLVEFPREQTGKIRRSALAEERAVGWTPAMLRP